MKAITRIAPRSSFVFLKRISYSPSTTHLHAPFSTSTARHMMASNTPQAPAQPGQSTANQALSFTSVGVKNTDINAAAGINLNDQQKLAVGTVLDV